MADTGHAEAVVVEGRDRYRLRRTRSVLGLVPGFVYVLALFVIGQLIFNNPRVPISLPFGYQIAWVEILLLLASIVAMAEQLKVAKPGVNNTTEVLLMGAIAIVQIVLFALAAAKVRGLWMFDNTEFLLLTIINAAQTAVAYQINAATLQRTITSS